MNLKRYNDWLIAIVGTAGPLAILALIAWNLRPHSYDRPMPGVTVQPTAGATSANKPQQQLALCAPIVSNDSDWQYIPLVSVLPKDAANASLGSYSVAYDKMAQGISAPGNALSDCRYRGESTRVMFNVLVRHGATGDQHLLLQKPALLASLSVPDVKCATGEGDVPCGLLIWTLYDEDTNHDGVINDLDARRLYVSDLAGLTLRRLSPANVTVLDWKWHARTRELFLVVHDHQTDPQSNDTTNLLVAKGDFSAPATPVIEPSISNNLKNVLH